jgi:predicted nucleic acid-binding protein
VSSLAIDTNVLVYAEGVERDASDAAKVGASRRLMRQLLEGRIRPVLAVQTLAELHRVLVTRGRRAPAAASATVRDWTLRSDVIASGQATLAAALELAGDHGVQIFDALILAAAEEARCDLLLTEDLQDGFAWRGVTVSNPFGPSPDRRLARLLADGGPATWQAHS